MAYEFKHYGKRWQGWSEHYGEWISGDLEYSPSGNPVIKRVKKSDGKNEWIFVESSSLEKHE